MALDPSLAVRKANVGLLKAAAPVVAIAGARVYGPNPPAKPTWPFVRHELPTVVPRRATCMDGSILTFTISGFAKGRDETVASTLGAAVAMALDGKVATLAASFPAKMRVIWLGNQTIRDSAESTGWHCIGRFEARVTS